MAERPSPACRAGRRRRPGPVQSASTHLQTSAPRPTTRHTEKERFTGDTELYELYRRVVDERPDIVAAYARSMTVFLAVAPLAGPVPIRGVRASRPVSVMKRKKLSAAGDSDTARGK